MGEVVGIVRPGPEAIAAGLAERGIVVRVYDVPSSTLLLERALPTTAAVEALAVDDSAFVAALTPACCLVIYDGDTGRRMPPPPWYRPGVAL